MIQRPARIDALTALRFFAAAVIVVGHADPIFGSFGMANAVPFGQGVSFFFVLSGFILAYNYPSLATKDDRRQFLIARFARVWPLHAATTLLWIAVVFNFDQSRFPGWTGAAQLLTELLLLQSWIPLHDWALSFNGVAWSLSVELFFYAMFPLLINRWPRNWHWMLMLQAAIVAGVIWLGNHFHLPAADDYAGVGLLGTIYFNPLVRLLEFSIGISTALLVRRNAGKVAGVAAWQWLLLEIATLVLVIASWLAVANPAGIERVFGTAAAYYVNKEGLWIFYGLLIGVFALSRGPIARLFSTRAMVFLGEISFALYLIHAIVIHYLLPYAERISHYGMMGYLLFWACCLSLSAAMFLGVEQPARRMILAYAGARREHARNTTRAWTPLALTASAAVVAGAALAMSYRPSLIVPLDDVEARKFLSTPNAQQIENGGAVFDGKYRILAVAAEEHADGKTEFRILLRNEVDLKPDTVIALHIVDGAYAIIGSPGDVVLDKLARRLPAGTRWQQTFSVDTALYRRAGAVAIAMYKDSNNLYPVQGGKSDWGGKRLIVVK